ncbi:MAG TPA: hypothetical protein VGH19_06820 [Verrucomicrobiae bacterium]
MRFTKCPYSKAEGYKLERSPQRMAAARRAVAKEKDKYALFPELVTHTSAEERVDSLEKHCAQFNQDWRERWAVNWRRARAKVNELPPITRQGLLRYWNHPEIQIPRDPVFLLGAIHTITVYHQSPWHQLRIRRQLQLIGDKRLPRDTFKSIRAWEDPRAGKKRWIHPKYKFRK